MISLTSIKKMQPSTPLKNKNSTEYSDEFTRKAISEVLKGRTSKSVAEFYSVKSSVIAGFMKAYRNGEIKGMQPQPRNHDANVHGKRYNKKFKFAAVQRVLDGETSKMVAININVAHETLRRWEAQIEKGSLCL